MTLTLTWCILLDFDTQIYALHSTSVGVGKIYFVM